MALRTKYPTIPLVRLEYSDNDYTYISSAYTWRELKKDVEDIRTPITIHFNGVADTYNRRKVSS